MTHRKDGRPPYARLKRQEVQEEALRVPVSARASGAGAAGAGAAVRTGVRPWPRLPGSQRRSQRFTFNPDGWLPLPESLDEASRVVLRSAK